MDPVARYRSRLERHVAEGRIAPALDVVSLWRERYPLSLEPELMRARIEHMQGHYCQARERILRALAQFECPPYLALDVINCLRIFVAHNALDDWASAYADSQAMNAEDQARAAAALSSAGAHSLALDWVDQAVAKAPASAVCLVNRALIRSYQGQLEASRSDLEEVIGGSHDSATAHWLLARLARQTTGNNHVGRLRQRARTVHDPTDGAQLQYALFKELDDLGDIDGAWTALMQGCQLKRATIQYDRVSHEALFSALCRRFPLERTANASGAESPVPIFVLGMHRSGTTLVERILAANPDVYAYGESDRLSGALRRAADHDCRSLVDFRLIEQAPALDASFIAQCYFEEGRMRIGKASRVTEKSPGNFQLIGFIHDAMPRAKIIHVRRNPMDLCFANLRELFADSASYSYSIEDVAHYHALYSALMDHWRQSYPGFILDIDYEDLVSDPVQISRRLYEFCGLDWTAGFAGRVDELEGVVTTLSSVQVREPIHTSSIDRWKKYAQQLEPLRLLLNTASPDVA